MLIYDQLPKYQIQKNMCGDKRECIDKFNEKTWLGNKRRKFIYNSIFPNGYNYKTLQYTEVTFGDFTDKNLYVMRITTMSGAHDVTNSKFQYWNLKTKSQLNFLDIVNINKSEGIKQRIKNSLFDGINKTEENWYSGHEEITPNYYRQFIEKQLDNIYKNNGNLTQNKYGDNKELYLSFCMNNSDVLGIYNFCTSFPAKPFINPI